MFFCEYNLGLVAGWLSTSGISRLVKKNKSVRACLPDPLSEALELPC